MNLDNSKAMNCILMYDNSIRYQVASSVYKYLQVMVRFVNIIFHWNVQEIELHHVHAIAKNYRQKSEPL